MALETIVLTLAHARAIGYFIDHIVDVLRAMDILLLHNIRSVGNLSDLPSSLVIVHKRAVEVT